MNRLTPLLSSLLLAATLILTACIQAAQPPGSPTPFPIFTVSPTALLPTATAIQATATDEATSTPPPTEIPPTPWVGAAPSPVKDELTFKVVTQMGGTFDAVTVDGNTVYLGIGPRFATVDISDPASPQLLWQSEVLPGGPAAIAVKSGLAYVWVGGKKVLTYDVSNPAQPPTAIEVSDPALPAEVVSGEFFGTAAMAASREVLYLASGGGPDNTTAGTLKLVDRANPERTLSEIALDGARDYLVAVLGDIAYVVENRLSEDPDVLLVLDVSDPTHPREIARQEMLIEQWIKEIVATDEALFLLSRSFPHEGCPAGLNIIDITNPASPQDPTRFDPQSCFKRFTVVGDTLAATSERGLEIYNVSDPANVALTGELAPPTGFMTVGRIALDRGLAYLVTTDGTNRLEAQRLRVLDVASPTPTLLNGDGLDWGYHELSIFQGLDVRGDRLFGLGPTAVGISDPANPRLATGDIGVDNAEGVFYWPTPALVGNVLYTGLLTNTPDRLRISGGLGVVDVSDPDNPVLVNKVPMEGFTVSGMIVADRHLIVFSDPRLRIYDVSDPFNPIELGGLDLSLSNGDTSLEIVGDTVYVATRQGDHPPLYVVDISDPSHPREIGRVELPGIVTRMVAAGDTIYMKIVDSGRILAMNVSDPAHPYLSGHFPLPVNDFAVDGDLLYLAAGGLYIVQVEK